MTGEIGSERRAAERAATLEEVAHLVADVLDAPNDEAVLARVRQQVAVLCKKFPVYGA